MLRNGVHVLREIRELYLGQGMLPYESGVTHLEYALQSAQLAERECGGVTLVVSALLHDIGHLITIKLSPHPESEDTEHEHVAYAWLKGKMRDDVCEVIRSHVACKRYLCCRDPGYCGGLSEDSRQSLTYQGGPMSTEEANSFERFECLPQTLKVRRWDDAAKIVGLATPAFNHYEDHIAQVCLI